MSATSWNSIAEGVVNFDERRLGYEEAQASPCASCPTSPCCTHLHPHTFKVTNLIELDHALYLLNFDRIELGLSASGEWSVYYRYPCRFLDRADFTCTVHNMPQEPQICVHYNPYNCWYKRVLTRSVSSEFLRIDRPRLEFIVSRLVFDELRNIVEVPDWAALVEAISNLEPAPSSKAGEPPSDDPVADEWKRMVFKLESAVVQSEATYTYAGVSDPCSGCQAYCCKTLVFPQSAPATAANLDFFRFCLGFPGIELGIADDGWSLIVKTTCRHLKDNRCSVYGMTERPLLCKYYDALKCTYRTNFGLPRPAGFVRVKLEQFEWLAECFQFDQHGAVVEAPPAEAIRSHVEDRWRSVGPEPAGVITLTNTVTAPQAEQMRGQ